MRKLQDIEEIGMLKIRQQLVVRQFGKLLCETLVVKFMKAIKSISPTYKPAADAKGFDEISRRFAMLTLPFVSNCVYRTDLIFDVLNIPRSSAILVQKIGDMIMMRVIVIPKVNSIDCQIVFKRVAKIVYEIIMDIKRSHLRRIQEIQQIIEKDDQPAQPSNDAKKITFNFMVHDSDTDSDTDSDHNSAIKSATKRAPNTNSNKSQSVYKVNLPQGEYVIRILV